MPKIWQHHLAFEAKSGHLNRNENFNSKTTTIFAVWIWEGATCTIMIKNELLVTFKASKPLPYLADLGRTSISSRTHPHCAAALGRTFDQKKSMSQKA